MKIKHIAAAALLAFGIGAAPAAHAIVVPITWMNAVDAGVGGNFANSDNFDNAMITFAPIQRVKKFIGITGNGFLHDHSDGTFIGNTGFLELRLDGSWTQIGTINAANASSVGINTFPMATFNHATLDGIRLLSLNAENQSYHDIDGDIFSFEVPEPGTLAILGLGLVGLGIARRRKSA